MRLTWFLQRLSEKSAFTQIRAGVRTLKLLVANRKGLDLVEHIDGLYRVIDLISEQGSGGLGVSASSAYDRKTVTDYRCFCSSSG